METKPEIENINFNLLNKALVYVRDNSKFYKTLLGQSSISSVHSLGSFQNLPFNQIPERLLVYRFRFNKRLLQQFRKRRQSPHNTTYR